MAWRVTTAALSLSTTLKATVVRSRWRDDATTRTEPRELFVSSFLASAGVACALQRTADLVEGQSSG